MTTCMSTGRLTQSMPHNSHHKTSFASGEAFLASGALVLKLLLRWCWLHLRHLFGFIAQARCSAPGDCQVPPQGRFVERGETLSLPVCSCSVCISKLCLSMGLCCRTSGGSWEYSRAVAGCIMLFTGLSLTSCSSGVTPLPVLT